MKKISIILLITLIIASSIAINTSYAMYGVDETEVYKKTTCSELLTYLNIPIQTTYVVYNLDGIEYPAYCLDVGLPGVGENGAYNVDTNELLEDENIWKVIVNGYPYRSLEYLGAQSEDEAYTATKQAIYCKLYDRTADDYGFVDTEEGERTYDILLKILEDADNSDQKISINNYAKVVPESDWIIDESNGITYRDYHIESNINLGSYSVQITSENDGNANIYNIKDEQQDKFDIGDSFRIIEKLEETEDEELILKVNVNLETKPIIIGISQIPDTQDYALTGRVFDEQEIEFKVKTEEWIPPKPSPTPAIPENTEQTPMPKKLPVTGI